MPASIIYSSRLLCWQHIAEFYSLMSWEKRTSVSQLTASQMPPLCVNTSACCNTMAGEVRWSPIHLQQSNADRPKSFDPVIVTQKNGEFNVNGGRQ